MLFNINMLSSVTALSDTGAEVPRIAWNLYSYICQSMGIAGTTESGIVILSSEVQSRKAQSSIFVTDSGITVVLQP